MTLAQVARRAGVSRQTVSNALNAPTCSRPATLERVAGPSTNSATARTGRPARCAPAPAGSSATACSPTRAGVSTPVLDRFLHALSESADEAGYRVLLFAAARRPRTSRPGTSELVRDHRVDAFVLSDTDRGDPPAGLAGPSAASPSSRSADLVGARTSATGSTWTARPAPRRPSTTSWRSATAGSPSSAGRAAPASATTGRAGWRRGACGGTDCRCAACGAPRRGRGRGRARPRRPAAARRRHRGGHAPATRSRSAATGRCGSAAWARAATWPWSASTTRPPPRCSPPD